MPKLQEAVFFAKNRHAERGGGGGGAGHTQLVAWLVVLLGGVLLVGNFLELGGVGAPTRQWSAWVLAGILLLHAVSLVWSRGGEEDAAGLRLPRWPLVGLPFVLWLGLAWLWDARTPWAAQATFYLAAQAWLLCWVVAATPGGRAMSWVWLFVVAGMAVLELVTALCWQRGTEAGWLPMGRALPEEWIGRWSGTLPLPGAFGAVMVLAGAPLLVMAFTRRLTIEWRVLVGYLGLMLLFGALGSFSAGAWMGVIAVLLLLPMVVVTTVQWRLGAWGAGIGFLLAVLIFEVVLGRFGSGTMGWVGMIQAGEPSWSDAWAVLRLALGESVWCGGRGLPYENLSLAAGVLSHGGGWSYGYGDWMDLATSWGLVGLGLAAAAYGGLLAAGWAGWKKLPFLVLPGGSSGGSGRKVHKHSPSQLTFTPETKILLGAAALGLSGFAVVMLGARSLDVPAVTYAFAVVAGVLARNVPQRGGSWRFEPVTRWLVSVCPALLLAGWLVWKVAPVARAQVRLDAAQQRLDQVAANPRILQRSPEILAEAEKNLQAALAANPRNAPAAVALARLYVLQSQLDPAQFEVLSRRAYQTAAEATALAPSAPEAYVAEGLACLLDNHVGEAADHVRNALDLEPSDPVAQYYAVAVLSLDPATRPTAQQLLDAIRQRRFYLGQVEQLEKVYAWGVAVKIPLEGRRQRPPPPAYRAAPAWPPLEGYSIEAERRTAAPLAPPTARPPRALPVNGPQPPAPAA